MRDSRLLVGGEFETKTESDYLIKGIALCGLNMAVVQIPDGMHGMEKVDIDCQVVTARGEKSPVRSSENQNEKMSPNRAQTFTAIRRRKLVQMHIDDSNI